MRLACLAVLLALPVGITAQAPKPEPTLTIDQLIAKLVEHRKAKTDAAKAEQVIAAELKSRLADLTATLKELGILDPIIPPNPPPVDLLAQKLRDAFTADKGKKDDALSLAALYRQAGMLAVDPKVPSAKELLRRVGDASATLIGPDALPSLRTLVAAELAALFGGPPTTAPLTEAQRSALAAIFAKLAAILEGL